MTTTKSNLYLIFLLLILICNWTSSQVSQNQETPYLNKFEHLGQSREYLFFSNGAPENSPLVIVLHGFTSDARTIMEYSKFNRLGAEKGFAVLYPQGSADKNGKTFWNVGYDFHADYTINDVDYILQLNKYVQEKYKLSKNNVFVTGMSNGGEMCYLLALKAPGFFKAIAPVAGTMMHSFFEDIGSIAPIPVLAVFGTADKITNYAGDPDNKDGWGAYQSIPFIIDYWTHNIQYDQFDKDTLPDLVTNDNSWVIREKYVNRKTNNAVYFYKVENGGHDWPGAWGNMDLNTTEAIWEFFKQYVE